MSLPFQCPTVFQITSHLTIAHFLMYLSDLSWIIIVFPQTRAMIITPLTLILTCPPSTVPPLP